MRVKHVNAGLMPIEGEFEYAALRLAHHDGVDCAVSWLEGGAVIVKIEEVRVQVK